MFAELVTISNPLGFFIVQDKCPFSAVNVPHFIHKIETCDFCSSLIPAIAVRKLRGNLSPHTLRRLLTYIPLASLLSEVFVLFIPTGLALPSVLTFKEKGEGAAIFSSGLKSTGSKDSDVACGPLDKLFTLSKPEPPYL